MSDMRRTATDEEVKGALRDLDRNADRVAANDWPGHFSDLGVAGMYSWWVDHEGAATLAAGLEQSVEEGRIYAGQTGATKWPSGTVGSATLLSRIGRNHLRGRVRGSTFRLTLAAVLCNALDLAVEGPRKLSPESELKLSTWMRDHLEVAIHPFPERDILADLEVKVLAVLDPPLNLEGRPTTPLRLELAALRAHIARGAPLPTPSSVPATRDRPLAATRDHGEHGRTTLHAEIEAIVRERGGWMTTAEIAEAVNARGRYTKRDGSPMTAYQIHGRTKNYPQLFERDRSRVRLTD